MGSGTLALFLCSPALMPAPAAAAASPETLKEVIVTAQKRKQNLQDVGVSVSAVAGSRLQALGINNAEDLSHAVPGLQLNSASGGDYGGSLTVRGIATSDYSPQQESPNSLYLDDVYVSAPNAQTGILFDVDQIEVLKGVQGTLFGRNSTGGLVNILSNQPTTDLDGYAAVTGGSFDEARFDGAIGGPITSWMQGRLALTTQDSQGYDQDRLAGYPNLNSINFRGVRGQLKFEFTDNLTGVASLYYIHDNNREGFYVHYSTYYDPADFGRPAYLPANINAWGTCPGCDLQGYLSPYGTQLIGLINHIGFLHRDFVMPTFRLIWNLPDGATVTSITNFSGLHFSYDESCSGAPQLTCQDPYRQDLKQWSQELRLAKSTDRLSWVTGIYGLYITQKNFGSFYEPYYDGTPFAFDAFNNISQQTKTGAAFGQIEYRLTSHWRPTFGLRINHDRKVFSSQAYYNQAGNYVQDFIYNPPLLVSNFSTATVGGAAIESETDWTGKAQMDYIWNPNLLTYASVSRGVKGAGFNANPSGSIANANMPFAPEHVIDYELGEKWTGLERRLRVNGAAFYYDYHNYQAYQYLNGITPFTSNDLARFIGAEMEVDAAPINGLVLQAGITGLSTRVFNVGTAQLGLVDQQAPNAPKWSANAIARYSWTVGAGSLTVMWSSDYVGSRYYSVDNTPDVYVHSSIGHNASVTYAIRNWQVIAGVTNLLNALRQTTAYDLTSVGGFGTETFMPPRWWTVSVRYQVGD